MSIIFPIKGHQTLDKIVKSETYYAEFSKLHQYCAQRQWQVILSLFSVLCA